MPASIFNSIQRRLIVAALLLSPLTLAAQAPGGVQGGGPGGGGMAEMMRNSVRGVVTATAADHVTIKTETGDVYQVFLTTNTRMMRDRAPLTISDIKVGDYLIAGGENDATAKTVHAAFAADTSAEDYKKLMDGLGKTWISGKITKIDDVNITVLRPDNVSQTFTVDENTSFRRAGGGGGRGAGAAAGGAPAAPAGEAITLADFKVGDTIAGRGAVKDNVFLASQLSVGSGAMMGMGGGGMGGGGRRRQGQAPDGSAPASAPATAPAPASPPK